MLFSDIAIMSQSSLYIPIYRIYYLINMLALLAKPFFLFFEEVLVVNINLV